MSVKQTYSVVLCMEHVFFYSQGKIDFVYCVYIIKENDFNADGKNMIKFTLVSLSSNPEAMHNKTEVYYNIYNCQLLFCFCQLGILCKA